MSCLCIGQKTLWDKEEMLVNSYFFSNNVHKSYLLLLLKTKDSLKRDQVQRVFFCSTTGN